MFFMLEMLMLWSLYFIQAKAKGRYEAKCVGLYQDNISMQLLIKNGKMSSRKKTKLIEVKLEFFFFIKDRVETMKKSE